MISTNQFRTDKSRGEVGEQLVLDWLESKGYTCERVPVEEQKKVHYDLAVTSPEGKHSFIEVKTEYKGAQTGCIFYETETNDGPGWCKSYTKEDAVIVLWVFPGYPYFLWMTSPNLLMVPYEKYPEKVISNKIGSVGHTIPIRDMLDLGAAKVYVQSEFQMPVLT
jgi:Domain of unknown function (DUF3883)